MAFQLNYVRATSSHIDRGEINKGLEIKADLLAPDATRRNKLLHKLAFALHIGGWRASKSARLHWF